MSNRFFIIVLVVIAIFAGVFTINKNKTSNNGSQSPDAQASNHVQGAGTSGVTLVEYGDFQCPACGAFYPVVKQVKQHFGDEITFQFRNFPLVQIHRHALLASKAAEAAAMQDKFWEMHDNLYETQTSWTNLEDPTSTFVGFALAMGLDEAKFRADMTSQLANDIVLADIAQAQAVGANSTPTFVLNGQKIENPGSLDEFIQVIEEAMTSR